MDHRPLGSSGHGIFQARILEWVFPSPGDLPNPEIEPGSLALHADSLLSEPPGKSIFLGFSPSPLLLRTVWLAAPCFLRHWPEGGPLASQGSRLEIRVHLFLFLFGYSVEISQVLFSVSHVSCSRFGHMALDILLSTGNCQKSVQ